MMLRMDAEQDDAYLEHLGYRYGDDPVHAVMAADERQRRRGQRQRDFAIPPTTSKARLSGSEQYRRGL